MMVSDFAFRLKNSAMKKDYNIGIDLKTGRCFFGQSPNAPSFSQIDNILSHDSIVNETEKDVSYFKDLSERDHLDSEFLDSKQNVPAPSPLKSSDFVVSTELNKVKMSAYGDGSPLTRLRLPVNLSFSHIKYHLLLLMGILSLPSAGFGIFEYTHHVHHEHHHYLHVADSDKSGIVLSSPSYSSGNTWQSSSSGNVTSYLNNSDDSLSSSVKIFDQNSDQSADEIKTAIPFLIEKFKVVEHSDSCALNLSEIVGDGAKTVLPKNSGKYILAEGLMNPDKNGGSVDRSILLFPLEDLSHIGLNKVVNVMKNSYKTQGCAP